jgi:hypothetical protein
VGPAAQLVIFLFLHVLSSLPHPFPTSTAGRTRKELDHRRTRRELDLRPPARAEGARPPVVGGDDVWRQSSTAGTHGGSSTSGRTEATTCGGFSTAGARGGDGSWRDFVCGHLIFPARADPGAVARARVAGGEDAAQPASVVEQRRGGAGGARWVVAVPRSRHHGSPPSNQLVAGAVQGRGWIARSLAVGVLEFLCHPCGDPGGLEEQGPAADVQGRRG